MERTLRMRRLTFGPALLTLLISLAVASAADRVSTTHLSKSATRYLSALRRTLHISMPGHNISVASGMPTVLSPMRRNELVLVVPPSHVITVQKALGSGGGVWLNKCALKLPRTLPRHFVLAMYVLHERYLGRANSLLRLWLESLPALDNATVFWTDAELEELEEERAIKLSRSWRTQLRSEYEMMVRVLLDDGCAQMADDLEDAGLPRLEMKHYLWAATVVSRHACHFADDFPVLLPLALRFHPQAAADVAEWGNETDPGASLYVGSEASLRPGDELTVWSEAASNAELLVHGGYVWDDLAAARVQLRLSAGVMVPSGDDGPTEERRRELLDNVNWTQQMDFELTRSAALNPDMLAWLRLVLASPQELARARSVDQFRSPMSTTTEQRALNALLVTLESTLGRYEYSAEEDEQLLVSAARDDAANRHRFSHRKVLAITYRLLCKRVLQHTRELTAQYLDGLRHGAKHRTAQGEADENSQHVVAGVTATGEVASPLFRESLLHDEDPPSPSSAMPPAPLPGTLKNGTSTGPKARKKKKKKKKKKGPGQQ